MDSHKFLIPLQRLTYDHQESWWRGFCTGVCLSLYIGIIIFIQRPPCPPNLL
jgi:hypothetical protein